MSLSWLAPSSASAFNPLIAYIVQYRETNRESITDVSQSLPISAKNQFPPNIVSLSLEGTWMETDSLSVYNTNYNLDGLQPSTSYQARVLVV